MGLLSEEFFGRAGTSDINFVSATTGPIVKKGHRSIV